MRAKLIAIMMAGALTCGPAHAQRVPVETRLDTLEKQVKALQRRVFQGSDGPTVNPEIVSPETGSTASGLPASGPDYLGRIAELETQLAEITNRLEQSENRIGRLEASLTASNDRITQLEKRVAAIEAGAPPTTVAAGVTKPTPNPTTKPAVSSDRAAQVSKVKKPSTGNAAEDAYMYGHDLWAGKFYPEARTQLKSVVAKFPKHRRASYAQNLIGRTWMDEGNYTEASQAFFDSYKKFPDGERAGDSLYFLGQSLVKLDEPARACEAYAEFDTVYGSTATADLKSKVAAGKREAKCK